MYDHPEVVDKIAFLAKVLKDLPPLLKFQFQYLYLRFITTIYMSQNIPVKKRTHYLYAVISVALVLFLFGMFGLSLLLGKNFIISLKEQVNILVELQPEATPDDVLALRQWLEGQDYVKPGSIHHTTKEAAADLLRQDFGDDFMKMDFQNPLYDVVSFNTPAQYMTSEFLSQIRHDLRSRAQVSDVFYQESLITSIATNLSKLGWITLAIGLIFLLVAITLIHNTIKLALYANRLIIKNMQLVGATWGFISRPYLLKSIRNGLFSGLIAIGILSLGLYLLQQYLPQAADWQRDEEIFLLFLTLLLLGILISFLSTYVVVRKYLQMRTNELIA